MHYFRFHGFEDTLASHNGSLPSALWGHSMRRPVSEVVVGVLSDPSRLALYSAGVLAVASHVWVAWPKTTTAARAPGIPAEWRRTVVLAGQWGSLASCAVLFGSSVLAYRMGLAGPPGTEL